jgi:hypothetical protein
MFALGPVAKVMQTNCHKTFLNRFVEQALAQVAREDLRKQGQDVKLHADSSKTCFYLPRSLDIQQKNLPV